MYVRIRLSLVIATRNNFCVQRNDTETKHLNFMYEWILVILARTGLNHEPNFIHAKILKAIVISLRVNQQP